jgi:hypothetical protein
MHSHVNAVLQRLDEAHAALERAVDTIPPLARTHRPAPERRSVAEVLEHVSLVEAAFTQRITAAISAAVATGLAPERAERAPLPTSIAAMLSNRSARRDAPNAVRPTGRLNSEVAWTAVERTRDELRAAIMQADGLALSTVMLAHPFFGSLTAYQMMELVAAHRERHAMQIREIATQLVAQS